MKKAFACICCLVLLIALPSCIMDNQQSDLNTPSFVPLETGNSLMNDIGKTIMVTTETGHKIIFKLNDSPAADDFYHQLPLSVYVEDYAESEKIFYPTERLNTYDTPMAQGAAGILAYYAPWGNIAVFYHECVGGSGLYALGEVVSGGEFIAKMAGNIQIEAVDNALAPSDLSQSDTPYQTQFQTAILPSNTATPEPSNENNSEEDQALKINVQVGEITFSATLNQNAAVQAFIELMREAPVAVRMNDYSGFEKVGPLGTSLPTSNSQITTKPGDIVLYNGNQIVVFYGSNSWSYTKLGSIDDLTGWAEALGSGDVTIIFSLR